jgi:hypothetical protein
MRDITAALREEASLHKASNTRLHSRLHEARREIEYLRGVIDALNGLKDSDVAQALRDFVRMERLGHGRPSPTHPIFRPDAVREMVIGVMERKAARSNAEVKGDTK